MTAAAETDVWESVADAVRDKRARDNRARRLVRHSRIYAVAAVICLIAGMVLVAMPRIQQTLGDRAVDEQARSRRPRCFRNPPVKASSNLPSHIISVFMKAVSHR